MARWGTRAIVMPAVAIGRQSERNRGMTGASGIEAVERDRTTGGFPYHRVVVAQQPTG